MLTISTAELTRHIRRYLGSSPSDTLETDEQASVDDAMRQGLRWFYFQAGHDWSFLRVFKTLSLTNGESVLPADFVRVASVVTVTDGDRPLEPVSSAQLQASADNERAEGKSRIYTVELKDATQYRMRVYPTGNTSVRFWYMFDPGEPGETNPPRGGAQHTDTIICACKAAADRILNPEIERAEKSYVEYQEKLAASITLDEQIRGSEL